jgi:hypothetical protein
MAVGGVSGAVRWHAPYESIHRSWTGSRERSTASRRTSAPVHRSCTGFHGSSTHVYRSCTESHGSSTGFHRTSARCHGSCIRSHGSRTDSHGSSTPSHRRCIRSHGSCVDSHGTLVGTRGTSVGGSAVSARSCKEGAEGVGRPVVVRARRREGGGVGAEVAKIGGALKRGDAWVDLGWTRGPAGGVGRREAYLAS